MRIVISLVMTVLFLQTTVVSADTWRLKQGEELESVSPQTQDKFMLDVVNIKKLVNSGQADAAVKAFDKLKKDHPEITGPDLDAFIEGEILYCKGKFAKAIRAYDKILVEYPDSQLVQAVLSREYDIATAFLAGRKTRVLKFFKVKGYASGAKIMEKITDRATDSSIGKKASVAVAENYEKRKKFNEAYLKWQDVSTQWETGETAKNSLLGMARCKHSIYNRHPENKRAFYDASSLNSAKTYYEKFKTQYPEDSVKIHADEILARLNEQQAYKQSTIGNYYQRTGSRQAANLYYNMVIRQWPGTQAEETARHMISRIPESKEKEK